MIAPHAVLAEWDANTSRTDPEPQAYVALRQALHHLAIETKARQKCQQQRIDLATELQRAYEALSKARAKE